MPETARHQALRQELFDDPRCQRRLAAGEVLLEEGAPNQRLYLVQSGSLRGSCRQPDGSERAVLLAGPGDLIGIQSAVLRRPHSAWTVTALEPSQVVWRELASGDRERLADRLLPLLVDDLVARQAQALQQVEVEKLAVLGQMAAGVAHELNNALAVITRGGDRVGDLVDGLMAHQQGTVAQAFALGYARGHRPPERQRLGELARDFRRRFALDLAQARRLAQLDPPPELVAALADHPEQRSAVVRGWELGATLHDLQQAAEQAGHVVTSMKQLGAHERLREEAVDLRDSLEVAVSIVGSKLRDIALHWRLDEDCRLRANQGELVQIWTNLLTNAAEALHRDGQDAPAITIASRRVDDTLHVAITDNGPGIDPAIRDRLFEPAVTTRQRGLAFGLGLGLPIARRLAIRYGGDITCQSHSGATTFTVTLPLEPCA
mgnify:CR=1 FL=1